LSTSLAQAVLIDASNIDTEVIHNQLKMGNPGPEGQKIEVNNEYLTYAGEPMIPVMGEVHYTRIPRDRWEETILKMKANGINIIAYYIFWIHHEESEGVFDWTGNKDVRAFTELCLKHQVWAYPRLGPWCHGEVRNGGLPDWIMKKEGMKLRSNDPAYQVYAERYYKEIAGQLNGLMYKDGGPIIGVQLENEYWRGKGGEAHISWLKETARKYGIDVPLYTITAWRSTSLPEYEVIPLWGGYPSAPWNTNLDKITTNDAFQFIKPVDDQSIGNREQARGYHPDYSPYPYLTCELGVGNQLSEHRRPIIDPMDGVSISLSKIASGSNLPGYYMFAGGLNPVGDFTTMEEDQLESGYWNEYPDISYDFQAAIRETGELSPAYQYLKALHYFLNTYGNRLAPMKTIIPEETVDPELLQYSFRTDGKSGFLFVSNYYRGYQKQIRENVQFRIQLENEELLVPAEPVDIADSVVFLWPVNMSMDEVQLVQSTTQPITYVQNKKYTDWYFRETKGIRSDYIFWKENIQRMRHAGRQIVPDGKKFTIKGVDPGLVAPIEIETKNGEWHRIFTLPEKEALQFWMLKGNDQRVAFLSNANLTMDEKGMLNIFSTSANRRLIALNTDIKKTEGNGAITKSKQNGFQVTELRGSGRNIALDIEPADLIRESQWISTKADEYNPARELYHTMLYRELDLQHTAEIRKATLYLFSQLPCDVRINDRWLNQEVAENTVNRLDLTGYLVNSENRMLLKFPYSGKKNSTAFALEVEYFNADKKVFVSDTTWFIADSYKIPAVWEAMRATRKTEVVSMPETYESLSFTPHRYRINLDVENIRSSPDCYLRINYDGDKARLYHAGHLVADNFNNQTTWSINLPMVLKKENELPILELEPLPEDFKIYFDFPPAGETVGKAEVRDYKVEYEYNSQVKVVE